MPEAAALGLVASPELIGVVVARLLAALAMGGLVALIYRRTRAPADLSESFTITLVLLAILIAMVTQVIGDNIARAFSLVGALSIVRFRTIVRDTQDTAYVIFAVAVGMAIGASNLVVAGTGLVVVGIAAFLMRSRSRVAAAGPVGDLPFELTVRLGLGADPEVVLGPTLDGFRVSRQLSSVATVRQGLAVEAGYRLSVEAGSAAGHIVNALNQLEGVQGVALKRIEADE